MRVLVVEDEAKTAAYLQKGLSESGFAVDVANDGEKGLELALCNDYACFVFDVMLPRRDGWSLLKELRGEGINTPAIFLTARDEVADRVKGLEIGADDYLVKPFAFSELLARIRSILRRGLPPAPSRLSIEDLVVDVGKRKAWRGDKRLELSQQEFSLLAMLASRSGEVVTRARIIEELWDMNFDFDANVVEAAIRRLRRKADDPFPQKLIHTVRGAGYVLEARGDDGKPA
jgi:two-component system copper resistance phosphate regulon response regulator CusR